MTSLPSPASLDRFQPFAPLVIRAFVGTVLIYGTQDNVFDPARMLEFRDFLAGHGFPYPGLAAHLSAYAQFACGVLILAGFATRPAALVMVANFVVALAMVHVGLPFQSNIAPLAMLAGSLFLLLNGPGPFALEGARAAEEPAGAAASPVGSTITG